MKYFIIASEHVEKVVSKELPQSFGLVLDGWTEGGYHHCALFAAYLLGDEDRANPLLAFSPLLDETTQDARAHGDWSEANLECYSKETTKIHYEYYACDCTSAKFTQYIRIY